MKKFSLLSSISVFIGLMSLVFCTSQLYAAPPFADPPQGGLVACTEDLAACEADPGQQLPGDGYPNTDVFNVPGHGPALSYTPNGDGTFTDDNSLLMWEVKLPADDVDGNCSDGIQANRSVHCVNNIYSWTDPVDGDDRDPDGTLFMVFLATLNTTCDGAGTDCASGCGAGVCGFAGYTDWRIPNVKELQSIVDYSAFSPASSLPGSTSDSYYWSATTHPDTPSSPNATVAAWRVRFINGFVDTNPKSNSFHARAVRP